MSLRPVVDVDGNVVGAEVVDETAERIAVLEARNEALLSALSKATTTAAVRAAAALALEVTDGGD